VSARSIVTPMPLQAGVFPEAISSPRLYRSRILSRSRTVVVSTLFMDAQEALGPPKRRGRKPTGLGQQVAVRCQPDLLAAVDAYRLEQCPPINRAAALRRIAVEFLNRRGFLADK
jgi:hypothetical protein